MSDKHTATPWKVSDVNKCIVSPVSNPRFGICQTTDEDEHTEADEANAEFIVTACNQHDDLVRQRDELLAACRVVLPFLKDCVARKGSSYSSQRIAADVQDALTAVTAALAEKPLPDKDER